MQVHKELEDGKKLLARPWLARPSSPNLSATVDSQMERPNVKVLVMRTSESGKTTLIKSPEVVYKGGFSEEERRLYKPTILKNLWRSTKTIAEALAVEEKVTGNVRQQSREDKMAFASACDLLKDSTWDDIFYHNWNGLGTEFCLDTEVASAILTVWKEAQFHQVLEKAILKSSFYVIDCVNQ